MLTQVRACNPFTWSARRRKGLEGFDCTKMSSAAYEERDDHRGFRSHPARRRGIVQMPTKSIVSRIVYRTNVFKSKRSNRRHLRDVLTGFRPVEMGCIA